MNLQTSLFPFQKKCGDIWDAGVENLDLQAIIPDDQLIVHNGVRDVRSDRDGTTRLYLLLTAPLAGKGQADIVCPESHQGFARDFLSDCTEFLIIGTSGLDDDLLNLLDTSIPIQPLIHLRIVGMSSDAHKVMARFRENVRAFGEFQIEPKNFIYDRGFRRYVTGPEIQTFKEFQF